MYFRAETRPGEFIMRPILAAISIAGGLIAATSAQAMPASKTTVSPAAPALILAHYDRPYHRHYRPHWWRPAPRVRLLPPRTVVPRYSYRYPYASTGQCREFRTRVTVDGRRQNAYGIACLQSDGTWRLVN